MNNFILVKYKNNFKNKNLKNYYKNNDIFFGMCIKQIEKFYPNANIHILTNENLCKKGKIYYHKKEIESNNYAKLHVFNLIQEKALYMDHDIIINRPFEKMPDCEHFNLFYCYENKKLNFEYPLYNTGLIWINNPSQIIEKELQDCKDDFLIHKEWVNDEYPISYIIHKNKIKMNISGAYIVSRADIEKSEIKNYQSIHYSGNEIIKNLFFQEYIKLI